MAVDLGWPASCWQDSVSKRSREAVAPSPSVEDVFGRDDSKGPQEQALEVAVLCVARDLIQSSVSADFLDAAYGSTLRRLRFRGDALAARALLYAASSAELEDALDVGHPFHRDGASQMLLASLKGVPGFDCMDLGVLQLLLEARADLNATDDAHGTTALLYAAGQGEARGDVGALRLLLQEPKVDLELASGSVTPLMVAVMYGNAEITALLIKAGASVNGEQVTLLAPALAL
jgi:hypothetical protein